MTEEEGRRLAAIPKWGEPRSQWSQDRPNTLTNAFGVVNADGQSLKGLQVELEVFISGRLSQVKFVFSPKRFELGRIERAYQLEVNQRKGLRPTDHLYSHEHYGEPRFAVSEAIASASFEQALVEFCERANLVLTEEVPHYSGMTLG